MPAHTPTAPLENTLTQPIEALANTLPTAWKAVLAQPATAQALKRVAEHIERARQGGFAAGTISAPWDNA